MIAAFRKILAIVTFSCLFVFAHAQALPASSGPRPYRILTSGKQVTIKSTKDIKSIMVWAASGHRVVEQKDINTNSFTFRVGMNEKIFFVMLELKGEERYTEKIGVE